MPYHIFNLEEAADYLQLDRSELEQLVKDRDVPFETRGGRLVFRRADLESWASPRILGFKTSRLEDYHQQSLRHTRARLGRDTLLAGLIQPDWIEPALRSKTKASVLRDLAALADRTGLVHDVAELIQRLEAREALCPTAMPGGLALLHPRHQLPHLFQTSFLVLARTLQPIHFGSPDGRPTDLFFLICCQDDTLHLHTLARLCLLGQQTDLLLRLREAPDPQAMHEHLRAAERVVLADSDSRPTRKRR